MFSGYDTFLSPPRSCRASASSSYALYNTVCVRVSVCVCHSDKVADCQTGHLLACFQSQQPFGDYTMYRQVGINEGARLLSVCLFCLSVLRESQALHRAFRACLLTWWLPWEQPDSGRLCSRLLRGLWEQRGGLKGNTLFFFFLLFCLLTLTQTYINIDNLLCRHVHDN